MKFKQIILYGILFLICFNPIVVKATPNYIGIDEGDELIYNITIDEENFNEYLDDADEDECKIFDKDFLEWKRLKYVIDDIGKEEDFEYQLIKGDIVHYDCVEVKSDVYSSKDIWSNEWEEEDTIKIYIADGEGNMSEEFYMEATFLFPSIIVATNIDWKEVIGGASYSHYFETYLGFVKDVDPVSVNYVDPPYKKGYYVDFDKSYCLDELYFHFEYDGDGILTRWYVLIGDVDGEKLLELNISSIIPGYDLVLVIGITGAFVIGLIILKRSNLKK